MKRYWSTAYFTDTGQIKLSNPNSTNHRYAEPEILTSHQSTIVTMLTKLSITIVNESLRSRESAVDCGHV